jgi:hypothetical protein
MFSEIGALRVGFARMDWGMGLRFAQYRGGMWMLLYPRAVPWLVR